MWLKEDLRVRWLIHRANKMMFHSDIIKGRFFFKVKHKKNYFSIPLYDKKNSIVHTGIWVDPKRMDIYQTINYIASFCDGEDFRYKGFDYSEELVLWE